MEDYIRRASEIQIAIMCKYLYTMHKNTQAVIDFFRYNAKILNVPNVEYLEQPLELRKKEKLVKLNENIYDYENSRYFESKVTYNDNQTYFSNEFLRPSFTKNDNSYIEKTPIIGMKSNVKEYFENYVGVFKPKKYKKNFKNFS